LQIDQNKIFLANQVHFEFTSRQSPDNIQRRWAVITDQFMCGQRTETQFVPLWKTLITNDSAIFYRPINGWVTAFPENNGQDETVAQAPAASFQTDDHPLGRARLSRSHSLPNSRKLPFRDSVNWTLSSDVLEATRRDSTS
jgi:hypothetical protein